MAGLRFQLDLFIPEDTFDSIPSAKKQVFRDAVNAIKAYAVRINEGQDNEEMTVRATYHRCTHDEAIHDDCSLTEQDI